MLIDMSLRSLAVDLGQNAIAVILSGSSSDGSAAANAEHKILRKPYGMKELAHTLHEMLD
ncbi:MAG: hypothetical protein ACJAVT_001582 [Yoonia sp.]|jgi:hypothetical protein